MESVPVVGLGCLIVLLEGLDGLEVDNRNSTPLGLDIDLFDLALGVLVEVDEGGFGEELKELALASPFLHGSEGGLSFAPVFHHHTDLYGAVRNPDFSAGITLRIPDPLTHCPANVLADTRSGFAPAIPSANIPTKVVGSVEKFLLGFWLVEIQSILFTVALPLLKDHCRPLPVGLCHFSKLHGD